MEEGGHKSEKRRGREEERNSEKKNRRQGREKRLNMQRESKMEFTLLQSYRHALINDNDM